MSSEAGCCFEKQTSGITQSQPYIFHNKIPTSMNSPWKKKEAPSTLFQCLHPRPRALVPPVNPSITVGSAKHHNVIQFITWLKFFWNHVWTFNIKLTVLAVNQVAICSKIWNLYLSYLSIVFILFDLQISLIWLIQRYEVVLAGIMGGKIKYQRKMIMCY